MQDLAGKTAFITGASTGLGEHFARLLASRGCSVALAARRTNLLEDLVGSLQADGVKAATIRLDVRETSTIGPALDQAEELLGPISILINNAGVGRNVPSLEIKVDEWDETLEINTRGAFFAAKEAASRMIKSGVGDAGHGRIINISSVEASCATPGLAAYSASKAALLSMTRVLAREWARKGISVNALCPGYIVTPLNSDWFATPEGAAHRNSWPRRRELPIEALDEVLLAMCGWSGQFITGSAFTIDDGQTL